MDEFQAENLPEWISENIPAELAGSTLFRFNVTLQVRDEATNKAKVVTVDMLPNLDIDMEILEDQMRHIPAQYAYWAAIYSEARLAVGIAERNLKIRRGKATWEVQGKATAENVKLTSEQTKLVVEADDDLVKADLRLQDAQMRTGKLYHMLEALKMKAELARSLIGFKRTERANS